MAEVYIPPPTISNPDPQVYYTIQAAFQLLTADKQKHVLPIAAQMIAQALQPYCVIDGYTALVRVLMPATVANDNYEVYIYFPRAVVSTDIFGQVIPVGTPQFGVQAPVLAAQLNTLMTPGTAAYAKVLAAVNEQLIDPITELTFVCKFTALDDVMPTEPEDPDLCTKPCVRRPPPRRPICAKISAIGQVYY